VIIWRSIKDEIDLAKFVFASPEGWQPKTGWTGRDMDDPEPLYAVELTECDGQERAIIQKFVRVAGTRAVLQPAPITEEDIAEAAEHLGYKSFSTMPVEASASGAIWLVRTDQ
jgi:hypothetical protein